jgi:protein-S-isoprenylcysteine O-methyltransferase Ste14
MHFDILWLEFIGFILYIPSAYLVVASMRALNRYGMPETGIETTTFVDSGIYKTIRQPMTLGMAIWSVAMIFVFQSALSVILCVVSLFCFYMSARTESEYDILKYGDNYREYMRRVPMWNIARGIIKERGCDIE